MAQLTLHACRARRSGAGICDHRIRAADSASVGSQVNAGLAGLPGATPAKDVAVAGGHALVGAILGFNPLQKVTILPRGQSKGSAWYLPNEEQGLTSRAEFLADIATTMGGRAAEEVIFGDAEVTTGASSDIESVTRTARNMVTRFGMSSLGQLALESNGDYSEDVAAKIDSEIRALIESGHRKAVEIMFITGS